MSALVNKYYLLEKFPGKGGWTYVHIYKELKKKEDRVDWKKVRGTIDGYEIRKYHMMPIASISGLILPVNATIRKHIKKKAGDQVHVILYPDNEPLDIPEEMLLCVQEEPIALKFFNALSESEQKFYVQWIYSAKKEETKIDRLAKTINRLLKGLKLYDKENEE
jgi:predicted transcriptional regulator